MKRSDDDFSVFEDRRAQQPQPQPAYNNHGNKRAVNKVGYALFAFFLGGLGIHKFYSGKPVQGVFYLLFSWTWIPSIIAFIEGIIALTKESDAYGNIYF